MRVEYGIERPTKQLLSVALSSPANIFEFVASRKFQ